MTKKQPKPRLYSVAELQTMLDEVVNQPTDKEVAKAGVELHGHFHHVFQYHEQHPEEPFDREGFKALSKRLMVEVFKIHPEEGE